jgi:hypothetical protein
MSQPQPRRGAGEDRVERTLDRVGQKVGAQPWLYDMSLAHAPRAQ